MIKELLESPLFSLDGRISRRHYMLIFIIGALYLNIIIFSKALFPDFEIPDFIKQSRLTMGVFSILVLSPIVILITKGIERCHDLGVSGFYQFIPFFFLIMIIIEGQRCTNIYGKCPKKNSQLGITLLNREDNCMAIYKTGVFKIFLPLLFFIFLIVIVILI